jgi:hypothetical protein
MDLDPQNRSESEGVYSNSNFDANITFQYWPYSEDVLPGLSLARSLAHGSDARKSRLLLKLTYHIWTGDYRIAPLEFASRP